MWLNLILNFYCLYLSCLFLVCFTFSTFIYIFFSIWIIVLSVSSVTQLCPTLCNPWTVAHHTSLSITNSQLSMCTCPKVEQLWKAMSSLEFPLGSSEDIVETTWQTSLCCVWLFVTPWTVSMPGFPILHYLLAFAQIHVQWIGDAF